MTNLEAGAQYLLSCLALLCAAAVVVWVMM